MNKLFLINASAVMDCDTTVPGKKWTVRRTAGVQWDDAGTHDQHVRQRTRSAVRKYKGYEISKTNPFIYEYVYLDDFKQNAVQLLTAIKPSKNSCQFVRTTLVM